MFKKYFIYNLIEHEFWVSKFSLHFKIFDFMLCLCPVVVSFQTMVRLNISLFYLFVCFFFSIGTLKENKTNLYLQICGYMSGNSKSLDEIYLEQKRIVYFIDLMSPQHAHLGLWICKCFKHCCFIVLSVYWF